MLKVTDISRLAEYGFEKMGKNRSGRDIWNIQIESGDFELCLTVNPLLYERPEIDGEIVLWGNVDVKYKDAADSFAKYGSTNVDFDINCDMVYRLIADGVVKFVDEWREAVA